MNYNILGDHHHIASNALKSGKSNEYKLTLVILEPKKWP